MDKIRRKPVSNFLIKRSLQIGIIFKILFVVAMTGILTTAIVTLVYNSKSQSGTFYYMSNDIMEDLELTSIIQTVLPSLVAAQCVTILIAFAVGLFSSRKIAVPIYKIEKWAGELKRGNLRTELAFREPDEMKDLTIACNSATAFYRGIFSEIDVLVETADHAGSASAEMKLSLEKIRKILKSVQYR